MTETPPQPIPTKVCPTCAAQAQTHGDFCPYCGNAYAGRAVPFKGRKKVAAAAIAAATLVAVIAVVVIAVVAGGGSHGDTPSAAVRASEAAAAEKAAAAKQEAAKQEAAEKAQADADAAERATRASAVKEIEKSVRNDATKKYKSGLLDGPIKPVTCTPTAGGNTDDLDAASTAYQCFAPFKDNKDGTQQGYNFDATMNWETGSYTWQLSDD